MKIINEKGVDIKLTADKLPTNFTLQILDTQSQLGMTVSDTQSQVGMTVSDATQFTIPANSYVSTTLSSLTHIYIKAGVSCLKCMQLYAVVCSCEAGVCSCNHSCSCGCLKPSFAVVLAVVPGLKSPFVLAVVTDFCAAVAVALAVVPSYDPSIAVVIAVVPG